MKEWIKTPEEIEAMRHSGRILAEILDLLAAKLKPGMTTKKIDELAAAELKKRGAEAAFLGYNGFPASICVSINSEIVHGIPGGRKIKAGDIVGLDFGVKYKHMITDGAVTVAVGKISAEARHLLDSTQEALDAGLAKIKPGAKVGDVSSVIEETLTAARLSVVKQLSGHGVGRALHEDPEVPNFGKAGKGPELVPGMTIAVEPMASVGSGRINLKPDGWTIETKDGSLAAQFEHTVLVTDNGAEILTKH